jgi:predicted Zn-dependent protease
VRLGRPGEGLRCLRSLATEHPDSAAALYNYADALRRTGAANRAIPLLERARAPDPDYPDPHYLLGKLRFEQDVTPRQSSR